MSIKAGNNKDKYDNTTQSTIIINSIFGLKMVPSIAQYICADKNLDYETCCKIRVMVGFFCFTFFLPIIYFSFRKARQAALLLMLPLFGILEYVKLRTRWALLVSHMHSL